ncbi:MAG: D-2-hydroxyacid dehydrogenase [Clostridia bacterium]|nr:D-2-hydroxyacid dehydrogenase [Clostridia bacterium]
MKSVVLDGFAVNPGDLSWDFLSEFGEYKVYDETEPSLVAERVGDADIILTNRVKITKELLEKCPNVKFVTALGTGFDMIDVDACKEHGVEACNVPGYSTDSVAQFAFTLLLSLSTDLWGFREIVSSGKWTGMTGVKFQTIKYNELAGKTVGVYGCGAIGSRFGEICRAFGMRVLGYRRSIVGKTIGGIEFVSEDKLLSESDYVSFHCPLTNETRGLVNKEFISKMKDGASIINTSRGAVINENDLADALSSKKLSSAAIDVMCKEPPERDNPLLSLESCIITPHCAWVTPEARNRLLDIIAKNIRSFIETGAGINSVL